MLKNNSIEIMDKIKISVRDNRITEYKEWLSRWHRGNLDRVAQEAKKMWITQHVVGICLNPEWDTRHIVMEYALDVGGALSLVGVKNEIKDSDIRRFGVKVDDIPVFDSCIGSILRNLIEIGSNNPVTINSQNIMNSINLLKIDIAKSTRRGVANYIIIDSTQVDKFRDKLICEYKEIMKNLPKRGLLARVRSIFKKERGSYPRLPVYQEEELGWLEPNDVLKYEFTTYGDRMKVFSSDLLSDYIKDTGYVDPFDNNIQFLIGYQSSVNSFDGPLALTLVGDEGWVLQKIPRKGGRVAPEEYVRLVTLED